MRLITIISLFALAGCSGQIQWGVPTEAKIQAQMAPVMEALQQHAQAINNQAQAVKQVHDKVFAGEAKDEAASK